MIIITIYFQCHIKNKFSQFFKHFYSSSSSHQIRLQQFSSGSDQNRIKKPDFRSELDQESCLGKDQCFSNAFSSGFWSESDQESWPGGKVGARIPDQWIFLNNYFIYGKNMSERINICTHLNEQVSSVCI